MTRWVTILVAVLSVVALGCSEDPAAQPAGPDAGVVPAPAPPPGDDDTGDEEPADEDPVIPEDDGGLACELDELTPLLTCALEECVLGFDLGNIDPTELLGGGLALDFDTAEILSCASLACLPELAGISPDCIQCVFAGLSGADTDELLETCGGDLLGDLGDLGDLGGGLPFP